MKVAKTTAGALILAFVGMAGLAVGQSVADRYIISAKAGGINYVEGDVASIAADGTASRAFKGDRLAVGDRLQTGAGARAEVLLNPGSYVRLGSNAELSLLNDSLDDLKLRVDRGAAMFEIFATKDFTISVVTDSGEVMLTRSGIYRVASSNGLSTSVDVFQGRARLASDGRVSAGSGKSLTIRAGSVGVSGFDRNKPDELARWSKDRGRELAEATASLKNGDVRGVLLDSYQAGRWNMWDTFGLWVFDVGRRMYCFLPFGFGWNSPYGFYYGHGIGWYNLPVIIPSIPPPSAPTTGNNSPSNGQDGVKTRSRTEPPAYTKIESDRTNTPVRATSEWPSVYETQRTAPVRVPAPILVEPAPAPAQNTARPTRP